MILTGGSCAGEGACAAAEATASSAMAEKKICFRMVDNFNRTESERLLHYRTQFNRASPDYGTSRMR